jgi:hypothetical protein
MSPAALRAVFSPESDADLFFLLTIYDPQNPSQVVARLSDGFYTDPATGAATRIVETADEVVYGVRSRGNDFIFLPMEITLPSEDEAQAPRCSLTLNDVTRYVTPLVRSINGPPKILMELVLSTTPNTVEASFSGFYISSITYNANTVSAELSMIDYEREPFPQHSFSPKYFPGLF